MNSSEPGRSEVMERIRQAMLWSELPLRELQKVGCIHAAACSNVE